MMPLGSCGPERKAENSVLTYWVLTLTFAVKYEQAISRFLIQKRPCFLSEHMECVRASLKAYFLV